MNFDRNGVLVTTSRPKPVLRKCYRVITVDSRDRDPTKYVRQIGGATQSDPGDYVVYLPRPFQKVTRIRLMNAVILGVPPSDTYVMMGIEGLNRMDECAAGADRAGYVDSAFAKIHNDRPVVATGPSYTVATVSAIANRTGTITDASGNGAVVTYTTSVAHNLTVGLTLSIPVGVTNFGNTAAVITSTPSTTTFTVASKQTGTAFSSGSQTYTVQNLQYTYALAASGASYSVGQYVTVSGLLTSAANVASIILSTPSATTFETANLASGSSSSLAGNAVIGQTIYYNDMSYAPNITCYNPPIGTLDRMHITLRRHLPLSSISSTTPANQPITFGAAENSFTFEIEYIDNVFEDVSTFETRLDNADYTPKFQM
jgi:hypothetical protein